MAAAAVSLGCDPSHQACTDCGGRHSTRTRRLDSQTLRHLSNGWPLLPSVCQFLQSISYSDLGKFEVLVQPLLHQSSYSAPALAPANPHHAAIHHEKRLLASCLCHEILIENKYVYASGNYMLIAYIMQ